MSISTSIYRAAISHRGESPLRTYTTSTTAIIALKYRQLARIPFSNYPSAPSRPEPTVTARRSNHRTPPTYLLLNKRCPSIPAPLAPPFLGRHASRTSSTPPREKPYSAFLFPDQGFSSIAFFSRARMAPGGVEVGTTTSRR